MHPIPSRGAGQGRLTIRVRRAGGGGLTARTPGPAVKSSPSCSRASATSGRQQASRPTFATSSPAMRSRSAITTWDLGEGKRFPVCGSSPSARDRVPTAGPASPPAAGPRSRPTATASNSSSPRPSATNASLIACSSKSRSRAGRKRKAGSPPSSAVQSRRLDVALPCPVHRTHQDAQGEGLDRLGTGSRTRLPDNSQTGPRNNSGARPAKRIRPLTWNFTVGVAGFEPTTSSSRTKRAAKLRYTPMSLLVAATSFTLAHWRLETKSGFSSGGGRGSGACGRGRPGGGRGCSRRGRG